MKKVLIISYFYPPAYFVGGQRVASWVKYLHKFGVYPIVITRRWNENQAEITDDVIDNTYKHEKFDTHEVYFLPNPHSLRDKLHQQKRFGLLRKFLTLKELLGTYFFLSANNLYADFYNKAVEIIQKEKLDTLIISGKPFNSFHIGYKLKKRFSELKWIADYRDEWSTHCLFEHNTASYLRKLEGKGEKKWTSNTEFIIAPDQKTASSISNYIDKKFYVIGNGFDGNLIKREPNKSLKLINLCYTGTVYANQNIEELVDAIRELNAEDVPVKMRWIGIELAPDQGERVRKYCQDTPDLFEVFPIVDKIKLKELVQDIDLYVLIAYKSMENVVPVKLFDYLFDGRPILFYPSDNGEINKVLKETKTGLSFNGKEEFKSFIRTYFETNKDEDFYTPNETEIHKYSRENKVSELAALIKQ